MKELKEKINSLTEKMNNETINENIEIVKFGEEDIEGIDMLEMINIYMKSTGGNILSNMLKYINFNTKYPQNNNIYITDLTREHVKIFNGSYFIVKKFKNIKEHIVKKLIENTERIIENIIKTKKITPEMEQKIKINQVSIKLISGCSPDEIVREERENIEDEMEFNLEERLRIKHLENKQQGLLNITYERIKEELYNGRLQINHKTL
jgi:hypothetical protein